MARISHMKGEDCTRSLQVIKTSYTWQSDFVNEVLFPRFIQNLSLLIFKTLMLVFLCLYFAKWKLLLEGYLKPSSFKLKLIVLCMHALRLNNFNSIHSPIYILIYITLI